MLRNAGRVLTRTQLIDRIWGSNYVGDTKTLDVHVKRIRSKIEPDPANPRYLETVRGLGYSSTSVTAFDQRVTPAAQTTNCLRGWLSEAVTEADAFGEPDAEAEGVPVTFGEAVALPVGLADAELPPFGPTLA